MEKEDNIINKYRNLKPVKKMCDELNVSQSNVITGKITKSTKINLACMIIDEICSFIEDYYKEDLENEKRKNTLDKRKNKKRKCDD